MFEREPIQLKIQQEAEVFLRTELAKSSPSDRRRIIEKFVLAALGSVPWIGGFLSAAAALKTEESSFRSDSLHTQWLEEHAEDKTLDRISAVSELVTGFASAYGVELLATVHWTSTREAAGGSTDPAVLTEIIGNWNERKGRLFTEAHMGKAASRLEELGWIGK